MCEREQVRRPALILMETVPIHEHEAHLSGGLLDELYRGHDLCWIAPETTIRSVRLPLLLCQCEVSSLCTSAFSDSQAGLHGNGLGK